MWVQAVFVFKWSLGHSDACSGFRIVAVVLLQPFSLEANILLEYPEATCFLQILQGVAAGY